MHCRFNRGFVRAKRRQNSKMTYTTRFLLKLTLVILLFTIIALYMFNAKLKPTIFKYAEHEARNTVYKIINTQIEKALSLTNASYSSFITLEKDTSGKICAITTDMSAMNTFKTRVTDEILKENADMPPFELKIPLGVLLGTEFLSGHGPNIPIKILPFSSVESTYSNSFTSAGINQTRHQIMMNFKASVGMLFPGFKDSMDITIDICIAETVIVGTTPQLFTGLGSNNYKDLASIANNNR